MPGNQRAQRILKALMLEREQASARRFSEPGTSRAWRSERMEKKIKEGL